MTNTIYEISAVYANYKKNVFQEITGKQILFAEPSKEQAKKDIERFRAKQQEERIEWFKDHEYGIFVKEYTIDTVNLFK